MVFLFVCMDSESVWGSLDTWQDDHDVSDGTLFVSAMIYLPLICMVLLLCLSNMHMRFYIRDYKN